MQRGYPPMIKFCLLCGLMISCWCVCYAPMAPDWCSATCSLAIGLAIFFFLDYATKDRVEVQDQVQCLLLVCICIMFMCSCFLALAKFYACIIWAFTQVWKTKGVSEVRSNLFSLSDLMLQGSVGPYVCLVGLVLCMQFPWRCGAH
jgi:hypothetical protein